MKKTGEIIPPPEKLLVELSSLLLEDLDSRKLLALYELKECAAAGGNVGYLVLDAELLHSGDGVSAACKGECCGISEGVRENLGALSEVVELEYADRAVPEDGLGFLADLGELSCGLGADIEDHVVISDVLDILDLCCSAVLELLGGNYIENCRDLGLGLDLLGLVDKLSLVYGLAYLVAVSGNEGVGDSAADDDLISNLGE